MKLSELIPLSAMCIPLAATSKEGIIRELAEVIPLPSRPSLKDEILEAVFRREREASTGIGEGIAVPHGRIERDLPGGIVASCGLAIPGVEFEAIDEKPAVMIFLIVAGRNGSGLLLKALARISRLVRNKVLRSALLECSAPEQLRDVLVRDERLHFS